MRSGRSGLRASDPTPRRALPGRVSCLEQQHERAVGSRRSPASGRSRRCGCCTGTALGERPRARSASARAPRRGQLGVQQPAVARRAAAGRRRRARRPRSASAAAIAPQLRRRARDGSPRRAGARRRSRALRVELQRVEQRVVHPGDRVEDLAPARSARAAPRRAPRGPRRAAHACRSWRRRPAAARPSLGPAQDRASRSRAPSARGPAVKPFELHGVAQHLPATSGGIHSGRPARAETAKQRLGQRGPSARAARVAEDAVDAGREVDRGCALARGPRQPALRRAGHRLAPGRDQLVRRPPCARAASAPRIGPSPSARPAAQPGARAAFDRRPAPGRAPARRVRPRAPCSRVRAAP